MAVRRIYGDALAETGDPRGELIAVQCALEDAAVGSPPWVELRVREAALLAKHAKTWLAPYGKALLRPVFRRGMIEHAQLHPTQFFTPAGAALAAGEPLTSIRIRDIDGDQLRALPLRPQLRDLHIQRSALWFSSGNADTLRQLGGLRSLTLSGVELRGPGDVEALATHVRDVEELALAVDPLGLRDLALLLGGHPLANVRSLSLPRLRLQRDLVEQIAVSLKLERLERLDLDGTAVDVAGIARLATNPAFQRLNALGLARTRVTADVIGTLDAIPALEELDLSDASLGEAAGAALARTTLPLRVLQLRQTGLRERGIADLARATLPKLAELHLFNNKFGPAGVAELARSTFPLDVLDLSYNDIGDEGARMLAESALPQRLRVLKLQHCKLSDVGVRALAAVPWPALELLEFHADKLGAPGLSALAGAAMPRLRDVSLTGMDLPKAPLAPLRRRGVAIRYA